MRIVLDTNVLVSRLLKPQSALALVVNDVLRTKRVLRSTETYAELVKVVMRPKFDRYITLEEREFFISKYYAATLHVSITERISACADESDNKFLELAIAGNAELIISGDAELLRLDPFHGVRIINPLLLPK